MADHTTPLEETVGALEQLKKDGKIRHWGLSNHDPAMLETARKSGDLTTSQVGYNLLDRRMEKEMFPYCLESGIAFMGYGTLAFGLLSGEITPETTFGDDDWRSHTQAFGLPLLDREVILKELKLGERLAELAAGYGKTLAQLAIAWAIGNPAVTVSLVGMRNEKELVENVVAAEWTLTEADRAAIDRIFEEEGIPTNIDVPQALTLPPSTKWG
ncbi:MAG: aldo/keto reductase [Desulfobacterales bacterium]